MATKWCGQLVIMINEVVLEDREVICCWSWNSKTSRTISVLVLRDGTMKSRCVAKCMKRRPGFFTGRHMLARYLGARLCRQFHTITDSLNFKANMLLNHSAACLNLQPVQDIRYSRWHAVVLLLTGYQSCCSIMDIVYTSEVSTALHSRCDEWLRRQKSVFIWLNIAASAVETATSRHLVRSQNNRVLGQWWCQGR